MSRFHHNRVTFGIPDIMKITLLLQESILSAANWLDIKQTISVVASRDNTKKEAQFNHQNL